MLFTPEQVSLILEDIDFQGCVLVASILGKEMLTDADKELLKKYKVNLDSLVINFPPAQQAYLFGRLVPILTPNQIGTISYKDFVSYLERNQYRTPTQREIEEYKIVANRSYSYIKGLGTRMKEMTTNFISEAELELATKRREAESLKVIKEELTSAVLERKAVQKITSDIAGRLNDWQRDWGRIVETELQNIYNLGNAQTIEDEHGVDALVYKEVYPLACRHCIRLYLTGGIGSRPRVFKLSELRANGTNIGKKVADWKPTESTTHPYCFLNSKVKIFTSNGWKNISEIKVGDEVLTHKGRFKKVIEVYTHPFVQEDTEIYNIKVRVPDRKFELYLTGITGNHPILTQKGWKEVSKLSLEDNLYIAGKRCECCGKIVPLYFNKVEGRGKGEKFCSASCFDKIRNKDFWEKANREEIGKKHSEILKKKYKENPDLRRKISLAKLEKFSCMSFEERKIITKKANEKVRELIKNGEFNFDEKFIHPTHKRANTRLEKKLSYILKNIGVDFIQQYEVLTDYKTKAGRLKRYFVDFYIPSLNVVLEADGSLYHKDVSYEEKRDGEIKKYIGADVFHFSEEEIDYHFNKCKERIERIINNHKGNYSKLECKIISIEKRGGAQLNTFFAGNKNRVLYNFAVEEDESYLADGVVVHNCRCELKYLPEGWVWDEQEGRFRAPKVSKDERVHRTSKVRIDVGDRHFEV